MKRLSITLLLVFAGLVATAAVACGDNDSGAKTATPRPATSATVAPTTASPATPTVKPSSVPGSPSASASPVADGTIDPLGAGQTTPWTIKPPREPVAGIATVRALRIGVHPEQGGWERIVFEFSGDAWAPGTVQYVEQAVSCGSGQPVQGVKGSAILEVAFTSAQAHDNAGKSTIATTLTGPGKQVSNGAQSCDFEGHVTWDFALSGKQSFKVSTLANPPRVVIDVKQ